MTSTVGFLGAGQLGDLIECGTTADVFEDPRAARTREYVRGAFG